MTIFGKQLPNIYIRNDWPFDDQYWFNYPSLIKAIRMTGVGLQSVCHLRIDSTQINFVLLENIELSWHTL